MKYLNQTFSVHMPGNATTWPFKVARSAAGTQIEYARCAECGAVAPKGQTHRRDADVGRSRYTVCFGLTTPR